MRSGHSCRDADAVVNACGALRGDDASLDAANHLLARFVAEAAASTEVRLVHVGSAAEYGVPASERAHEEDHPTPTGAYGRSKLAGTRAVLATCAPGQAVVARVFNPVGPGQPDHLPVAEFARAARSPDVGPVTIRNSATERDFLAIDDVGRALVALAVDDRTPPAVVNVCSGVGLSYGAIARAILDQVGSDRSIRSLDEPTVLSVVGDPTRLAQATGIRLESTAEGIAELALAAR